jgi:hypothetical protein
MFCPWNLVRCIVDFLSGILLSLLGATPIKWSYRDASHRIKPAFESSDTLHLCPISNGAQLRSVWAGSIPRRRCGTQPGVCLCLVWSLRSLVITALRSWFSRSGAAGRSDRTASDAGDPARTEPCPSYQESKLQALWAEYM